jgi:hypothetical protein
VTQSSQQDSYFILGHLILAADPTHVKRLSLNLSTRIGSLDHGGVTVVKINCDLYCTRNVMSVVRPRKYISVPGSKTQK